MQQLIHHSGRDYKEAASDAARHAKSQLEAQIARGRDSATNVLERIMREVPRDQLVRGKAMVFDGGIDERPAGSPQGLIVELGSEGKYTLHSNAFGQMCERAHVPTKYANWLLEPERAGWGTELVAENLRRIYAKTNDQFLSRSYSGQMRGFLSDRFNVGLDSRPLIEAFTASCSAHGLVPIDGNATDVRFEMKALLPIVFEPAPNEVIAFGVKWHNSDYGKGTHQLQLFMLRLVCTNYMVAGKGLRQIHLGKRLDDAMRFSQETYKLDSATVASAIRDLVSSFTETDTIDAYLNVVKEAHETAVNVDSRIEALKAKLSKTQVDRIRDAYRSADVVNMPAGNTVWRLSNAISWVAGQSPDVDEKLDLQEVAGSVLPALPKAA